MTTTTYPIIDVKHFTYNKDSNRFTANVSSLPVDPSNYREFLMRNTKTGNEVIFYAISDIYDRSERPCGTRFQVSYDDVDRFPGLMDCFADILLD